MGFNSGLKGLKAFFSTVLFTCFKTNGQLQKTDGKDRKGTTTVYVKSLPHILPRGTACAMEVVGENRETTGWKTNPVFLE